MSSRSRNDDRPNVAVGQQLERMLAVAHRARRPVLLEGPTGVGKSEVVAGVAAQLGIELRVLDLSLLEPPDLVGLPFREGGRTVYAAPAILPKDGEGIVLLEELNRAERYIRQPALQLLSARTLHEYVLPEGWSVFAAVNPEGESYEVIRLDPALRARFCQLRVHADRKQWLAWALGQRVHRAVLHVARTHDRFVESVAPRTWKYVSDLLCAMSRGELADEDFLSLLLGGYLPGPWVRVLLASLKKVGWELDVDVYAILKGYAPGTAEARSVVEIVEQGQTDKVDELTLRVQAVVEGAELSALVGRGDFDLEAFEVFLSDLPGDHREMLQEALGANMGAVQVLDLGPDAVLTRYHDGEVRSAVLAWAQDSVRRHRAWALGTSVPAALEEREDLVELLKSATVRRNVGCFLNDLGPHWAPRVEEGLRGLGMVPLRGGAQ